MNANNNWAIGETVLLELNHYGNITYKAKKITRITPSGIVVLDDGQRFRNGVPYPVRGGWDARPEMIKFDATLLEAQKQAAKVAWVRREGVGFLTDAECLELYAKLLARARENKNK